MSNFMGKENILLQDIVWHSSENETFGLNEMFQWITSKFAIFYVHIVFVFHFSFWAQKRPGKSKVELEWKKYSVSQEHFIEHKNHFFCRVLVYSMTYSSNIRSSKVLNSSTASEGSLHYYSLPWKLRHAAHARESR